MFCRYCGLKLDDSTRFCTRCGALIAASAPERTLSDAGKQPRKQPRKRTFKLIFLLIILAVAVAWCLIFFVPVINQDISIATYLYGTGFAVFFMLAALGVFVYRFKKSGKGGAAS